eukprot:TRINITY_DN27855_c0_g1_i1.p1 TRINITY_DN27855_c0_g1~~TRINITY_DN27855_c0_g1_i1.p1  ORF type:complete len:349 (-),score=78.21 TRINITY_DN27855_c0_g1_i1:166-1212(-)
MDSNTSYQRGFGNYFTTEAVPNSLPTDRIMPQKCPHGLYAEQLSGSAFTVPRHDNQRVWLYRARPSVGHLPFVPSPDRSGLKRSADAGVINPNQLRWGPLSIPEERADWLDGLTTVGFHGCPTARSGIAIHQYACNADMVDTAFCNADGDFLIVPQQGGLRITTEMGIIDVEPCWIAVVQRGIRFSVSLHDESARGYVLEIYESRFKIPDMGPIGTNHLALPQDFETPVAAFDDRDCDFTVVHKFGGELFSALQDHSCFDVVAWHGNYAPYRYDLRLFSPINTVLKDHPDPSIFTVLTAQSVEPGVAVADFVIFPPRWMVAEDTFRPPYFHRNVMTCLLYTSPSPRDS